MAWMAWFLSLCRTDSPPNFSYLPLPRYGEIRKISLFNVCGNTEGGLSNQSLS